VAEFQWWLLIVGLVVGGTLVAVLAMESTRRDADVSDRERAAEATFIAAQLTSNGERIDPAAVEEVLRAHHDYLRLPPPDRVDLVEPNDPLLADWGLRDEPPRNAGVAPTAPQLRAGSRSDTDADDQPDEVRDGRRGRADQDLPPA
jgi:hypothetical protein